MDVRRVGERHKIVRQTDSGFGVDAQAGPGAPLSPEALLIRALPHDLVMGGISHTGSQHYHTNALISHASKVMLKILQARLQ